MELLLLYPNLTIVCNYLKHILQCAFNIKFYRNIDMELSLEKANRVNAIKFVAKCDKNMIDYFQKHPIYLIVVY